MVQTRRKKYKVDEASLRGVAYQRAMRDLERISSPKTRKDQDKIEALKEKISRRKFRIPRTPQIIQEERASRSNFPSCLYFGMENQFKLRYPKYLFCSHCRAWEQFKRNPTNKNCKRTSPNFACRADHRSWVYPSTLIKPHHSLFADIKTQGEEDEGSFVEWNSIDIVREEYPTTDRRMPAPSHTKKRKGCTIELSEVEERYIERREHENIVNEFQLQLQQLKTENSDLRTKLKNAYQRNYRDSREHHQTSVNLAVVKAKEKAMDIPRTATPHQQTLKARSARKGRVDVEKEVRKSLNHMRSLVESNKSLPVQKHKRVVQNISNILLSNDFMDGDIYTECMRRTRNHLRREIFPPWKVLRAMDLAGGGLCYQGIEILRECETGGQKYYRGSILPCASSLKRHARLVEKFAEQVDLKFQHRILASGVECIEFDTANTVRFAVKAFKLEETSKRRSVSIATSIDAAQLSKRQIHTTMGIKIQDRAAICPITNQPLFANMHTQKSLVQSRNCCIPLKIVLAPETKNIYKEFASIFHAFNKEDDLVASDNPDATSSILGEECKPIKSPTTCDLSAKWKGLCRGGAMKVRTYACECCAIQRLDVAKANPVKCTKWCRDYARNFPEETANWHCYHHEILTEDKMKQMEDESRELKEMIDSFCMGLEDIRALSYIDCKENPFLASEDGVRSLDNPVSIHYDFQSASRTRKEVSTYAKGILRDLMLRDLHPPLGSTLLQRQDLLHNSLKQEFTFSELQRSLEVGKLGTDEAVFVLMNTIPCILHMENRVGLKILSVLLEKGLSNARSVDYNLYSSNIEVGSTTENQRIEIFIGCIEDAMSQKILGTEFSRAQWSLPYDKPNKSIDDITLDNNRTRKVIQDIDVIIDLCFNPEKDEELILLWKESINHYRGALAILRTREELSDREILEFQYKIDSWFQDWISLSGGNEGVTNYIHMLSSGHVAEYMFKWRNLWIHSQQGWEALNAMIKTFFLRRTGRGGSRAKEGDIQRSRLLPLAKWFQRRLIWMTGYTLESILTFLRQEGRERHNLINENDDNPGEQDVYMDDLELLLVDGNDNSVVVFQDTGDDVHDI